MKNDVDRSLKAIIAIYNFLQTLYILVQVFPNSKNIHFVYTYQNKSQKNYKLE